MSLYLSYKHVLKKMQVVYDSFHFPVARLYLHIILTGQFVSLFRKSAAAGEGFLCKSRSQTRVAVSLGNVTERDVIERKPFESKQRC